MAGGVGDCCNDKCTGGGSTALACVAFTSGCEGGLPCCSGVACEELGKCTCLTAGAACGGGWVPGDEQCCSRRCTDGVCQCVRKNEFCETDGDCCGSLVCGEAHLCHQATG